VGKLGRLQPDKSQMTVWRMRVACWITKGTDTHPECVILLFTENVGFPKAPQC